MLTDGKKCTEQQDEYVKFQKTVDALDKQLESLEATLHKPQTLAQDWKKFSIIQTKPIKDLIVEHVQLDLATGVDRKGTSIISVL